VVYDKLSPGDDQGRFAYWDRCRSERQVNGLKFDVYKELYRRIDGGHRGLRTLHTLRSIVCEAVGRSGPPATLIRALS